MKGQVALSVGGLGSQSVELFGRNAARLPPVCQLSFAILCISSMPMRVDCLASNALNPNMGRVTLFTPRGSCSTILLSDLI